MNISTYILRKLPIERLGLDDDKIELLGGSATTLFLSFSGLFISYLFNIFLARWYGATAVGIYTLAVTLVAIASLIGQLGTKMSVIRFVSEYSTSGHIRSSRRIYWKIVLIVFPFSTLAGMGLFAGSTFLADKVFHDPSLIRPLQIAAFAVPFASLMAINASSLRGLKRIFDSYFFESVFIPGASMTGLVIATYFISQLYTTPIWVFVISVGFGGIISLFVWLDRSRSGDHAEEKVAVGVRVILRTSLPMFVSGAMLFILGWTDVIMLGALRTTHDVGIYKVALRLSILVSLSLSAANSIIAPKFAELYWHGKNDQLRSIAQFASKLIFWSSFPLFMLLVLFAKPVLNIFGDEFIVGALPLIVLGFGQLVNASCGSVGFLLDMTGNQQTFRNAVISGAVLNIILNTVLIPPYGIFGAAMATAASTILWNLAASISVYRIFGFWIGYKPQILER